MKLLVSATYNAVITSNVLRHIWTLNIKITVNIVYMFIYVLESKDEKESHFGLASLKLSVTVHVLSHCVLTLVLNAALSLLSQS